MQISQEQREVLTNLSPEDQSEFDLPTSGRAKQIIQDILISKQYANPLKAACREALQNTLDANKEAGNEHLPITITLPTEEEPLLIFEDLGVGIGAERFENIYRKWGESTKRSDNLQMGGFGVGRFSALAVSPQVTITSVCDGIKYHHVLYINEHGNPATATLNTEPSTDPSGTKLSIAINPDSINVVHKYIEELTQWVEQPISFKNSRGFQNTSEWKVKGVLEKNNYALPWYFKKTHSDYLSVTVVVGQLPYEVPFQMLNTRFYQSDNTKGAELPLNIVTNFGLGRENRAFTNNLTIRVPIGSIELTSNRENIKDSLDNISRLRALVAPVIQQLEDNLSKLVTHPTLRESLKAFYEKYPFSTFNWEGVTFSENRHSYNPTIIELQTSNFESCYLIWGADELSKNEIIEQMSFQIPNLSDKKYPKVKKNYVSLKYFLDCFWVVYPKGMKKHMIRKLANVPANSHIFAISTKDVDVDPEEYVKSHRLLKLMPEVITVNSKNSGAKASRSSTSKPSLTSLIKSGAARCLKPNFSQIHNIYESTEKIVKLPESGVYIVSETAKHTFQPFHIPPSLRRENLVFVSYSLAEKLKEYPDWTSFTEYCTKEFDELTVYYKQALELINYTVDSLWFDSSFLFGDKQGVQALVEILSVSSITTEGGDDIRNLIEFFKSPTKANWLSCISSSPFIALSYNNKDFAREKESNCAQHEEREKNRKRLQKNHSWHLSGKSNSDSNYFPDYNWTEIPIFNKLVQKYPLLTYLLRYYNFRPPGSMTKAFTFPQQQQELLPHIIEYINICEYTKICDEIPNNWQLNHDLLKRCTPLNFQFK